MRQLNMSRLIFAGLMALILLQFPVSPVFGIGQCRKGVCGCSEEEEEKIKGLIGRIRALKEVADLTRKEYNDAVKARDKERDGIWGFKGSLAGYSNSLLGMASISPATPNWVGWANMGIGIGQSPTDWDTWANVGSNVIGDDYVMDRIAEEIIVESARRAGEAGGKGNILMGKGLYYKYAKFPDTPWTVGQVQTGAKVVGAAINVYGCVKATQDLVGDLSNYFEARREAKQLQKQLDRLDEQIEDILKELEELRKRCASKQDQGEASRGSFTGSSESRKGLTGAPTLSLSDQEDRPNEAVLQKLFDFQGRLDRIEARFRDRLLVPLSPFMLKAVWKEMDRKLLLEISRDAFPDLKTWPQEVNEAVELGREVEKALKL